LKVATHERYERFEREVSEQFGGVSIKPFEPFQTFRPFRQGLGTFIPASGRRCRVVFGDDTDKAL